jgi:hypothetical protein
VLGASSRRHLPLLGILARASLMWMEILLTRPLLRSLNRSARLVEDAAVALFLISITSSRKITAQLSDESTLVWDSVPLLAHNATIQGYEAMHMIRKGQVRWLSKGDIAAQVRFITVIFGLAAA